MRKNKTLKNYPTPAPPRYHNESLMVDLIFNKDNFKKLFFKLVRLKRRPLASKLLIFETWSYDNF